MGMRRELLRGGKGPLPAAISGGYPLLLRLGSREGIPNGIPFGATLELLVRRMSVVTLSLYRYVPGLAAELEDKLGCMYIWVDMGRALMFCGGGGPLRAAWATELAA